MWFLFLLFLYKFISTAAINSDECPMLKALPNGAFVDLQEFSLERMMSISKDNTYPGSALLGRIAGAPFSIHHTLQLRQPDGSFVAELVSPTYFWDRTAKILDCAYAQIGEIRWSKKELMGLNIFNPYLASAKVFNDKGVHIADLGPTDIANWFAIKKDGKKLIEFKLRQAPWKDRLLGVFGKYSSVEIDFMPGWEPPPFLLMDPRFLTLVAAAHLAPGSLLLPLEIGLLCFLACCGCCLCFCRCRSQRNSRSYDLIGAAVMPTKNGSRDVRLVDQPSLLSGMCCKRTVPQPSNAIPERLVSHRF